MSKFKNSIIALCSIVFVLFAAQFIYNEFSFSFAGSQAAVLSRGLGKAPFCPSVINKDSKGDGDVKRFLGWYFNTSYSSGSPIDRYMLDFLEQFQREQELRPTRKDNRVATQQRMQEFCINGSLPRGVRVTGVQRNSGEIYSVSGVGFPAFANKVVMNGGARHGSGNDAGTIELKSYNDGRKINVTVPQRVFTRIPVKVHIETKGFGRSDTFIWNP